MLPDLDAIASAVAEGVRGRTAESFRITARRADKRFPMPSPDIEREVGRRVQQATGWPVNLDRPNVTIRVEVLTSDAFFYFDRQPGAGGLPIGTSGKVMCLLSGGIDSPVAAWRLIRRGCRAHFVHFHSYPILSHTSQDKVRELVTTLTRHQLRSRLFLVPFGGVQQQVVVAVPPPLRVVVYRRLMMRIAERLAERDRRAGARDRRAVGQVASQTIDNLAVVGKRRLAADAAAAHRVRQGRDHAATRSGSARTRRRSFRTKTVARSSHRDIPATRALTRGS